MKTPSISLKRISKSLTNNPSRSKSIIQIDIETNEIINKFPSIREASRQTGFSSGNISMCAKGNYKTAHGYIWRYA